MAISAGSSAIEIISPSDLLIYLGLTEEPPGTQLMVDLANGVVTEAWSTPVTPVPYWVSGIALEVAGRALRNPKGLASWTRSVDDASRTERLPETAARAGVYLTDDERIRLSGRPKRRRMGTIRTVPGYLP